MNLQRFEKLGWGALGLVLAIVFVLSMLGLVAILGYVAFFGAFVLAAGIIVAVIVRLMQLQLRLVIAYGLAGLVGAIVAIANVPRTSSPLTVAICLVIGIIFGGALYFTKVGLYRALTQPEAPREEYLDDLGERHFFCVCRTSGPLKDRPLTVLLVFLVGWAVVLCVLGLLVWFRVLDGPTSWASVGALLCAFCFVSAYSALQVEQETGVQIFSQLLPSHAHEQIGFELTTFLPKPAVWVSELLCDIWSAIRQIYSVSVRI